MPTTMKSFQEFIRQTFGAKDAHRGIEGTFMWFIEEVGELSEALRAGRPTQDVANEFADVLAWLATLANIAEIDLEEAIAAKYGHGCPACQSSPCHCGPDQKP